MSKDFPNRNDWLAIRATSPKLPAGRYIHISKPLMTIRTRTGGFETVVNPARGTTFSTGSNAEKRRITRAVFPRIKAMSRTTMLANRRLRQRRAA